MDRRIKKAAEEWLPKDINAIPLSVWDPYDNQEVEFQEVDGLLMTSGAPVTEGTKDILLLSGASVHEDTDELLLLSGASVHEETNVMPSVTGKSMKAPIRTLYETETSEAQDQQFRRSCSGMGKCPD